MSIQTKHVYDPPAQIDGARFLVDRLWPRGMKKESLRTDVWLKGVAPTKALRKWFAHDPEKWPEFKRRYAKELNAHPDAGSHCWTQRAKRTSPFSTALAIREHNNAVALKTYLDAKRERTVTRLRCRRKAVTH